jgi:hypothetical protein
MVDVNPIIPLMDAVDQMMDTRRAYEPALEIIADIHDIDVDESHHGVMSGN